MINFDEFWKVYPRKDGKAKAMQRWDKLKPEQQAAAIKDVEARVARYEGWQDKKFIPHAPTYLNQQRWLDEWEDQEQTNVAQLRTVDDKIRRQKDELARQMGYRDHKHMREARA